jgi:hypothetical protein
MKTFLTTLALVGLVAATSVTASAAPKPGFEPGTWLVKGTMSGQSSEYGQTIRTKGSFTFTLRVGKNGAVGGTGAWRMTQLGSGAISSKITGVAAVKLSGTPTQVRYGGTLVLTSKFSDGVVSGGNTATVKKPLSGGLTIKKALSCKVTGGQTIDGVVTTWTATLQGVTCVS